MIKFKKIYSIFALHIAIAVIVYFITGITIKYTYLLLLTIIMYLDRNEK